MALIPLVPPDPAWLLIKTPSGMPSGTEFPALDFLYPDRTLPKNGGKRRNAETTRVLIGDFAIKRRNKRRNNAETFLDQERLTPLPQRPFKTGHLSEMNVCYQHRVRVDGSQYFAVTVTALFFKWLAFQRFTGPDLTG